MENIEELKREIFSWAAESGQELVAIEISRMWFRLGGNTGVLKLHQIEDADGKADWRAINNNRQQIFRWLRGETKAARTKTQALAKAMEAALPAERYARPGHVNTVFDLCCHTRVCGGHYRVIARSQRRPAASCEGIASYERNTAPDQRLTCTEERPMRTQDRITSAERVSPERGASPDGRYRIDFRGTPRCCADDLGTLRAAKGRTAGIRSDPERI